MQSEWVRECGVTSFCCLCHTNRVNLVCSRFRQTVLCVCGPYPTHTDSNVAVWKIIKLHWRGWSTERKREGRGAEKTVKMRGNSKWVQPPDINKWTVLPTVHLSHQSLASWSITILNLFWQHLLYHSLNDNTWMLSVLYYKLRWTTAVGAIKKGSAVNYNITDRLPSSFLEWQLLSNHKSSRSKTFW